MKQKRAAIFIAMLCMMAFGISASEGILPDLETVYGVDVPSFTGIINREPDSVEKTEAGKVSIYSDVDDSDYYAYGNVLKEAGCSVDSYSVNGDTLEVIMLYKGSSFTFRYDTKNAKMYTVFPEGVNDVIFESIVSVDNIKESDQTKSGSYDTIGSIVQFGHFEQDNNLQNGTEPIEWIVLDVQGDKSLIFSKYLLELMPYDATRRFKGNWEKSSIRKWLNGEFLSTAFTEEEQSAILITEVDNSINQGLLPTKSGKDTDDFIFLLSYREYSDYVAPDAKLIGNETTEVCAVKVIEDNEGNLWWENNGRDSQHFAWWLRSPGETGFAYLVAGNGEGNIYSGGYLAGWLFGIRPALWVSLHQDNK